MTHRRIRDNGGKVWDVWEVYPSAVERRMSGEHPLMPPDGSEDRRTRREVRILVPAPLQQGWLAFQSGEDRRRIAPIPDAWATLDEAMLLSLLTRADRIADSK